MPRVRSFFLETGLGTGTRFDWTSGGEGVDDARVAAMRADSIACSETPAASACCCR